MTVFPGRLAGMELAETLKELAANAVARRLWAKDAGLWKSDASEQKAIRNRLGWLDLPARMPVEGPALKAFADEVKDAGFRDTVLLGMGGSSLCPEVFWRTFGARKGYPRLHVLDTTDPGALRAVEKKINLKKTFFIVSSKSGGTIEMNSLFRYFWTRLAKTEKKKTGGHFAAVTDPGTPLESLAAERGFRRVFRAPADVGGRYSALTFFGLLPAALLGVDVLALLDRAQRMAFASAAGVPPIENPGVWLGAVLGAAAREGRDKVTFVLSPEIASFGLWVEQLIAESTGKEGTGIVPIEGETLGRPSEYGPDRLFVFMGLKTAKAGPVPAKLRALEAAGHPVVRLLLESPADLGAEFLRWEIATAVAGHLLGVNPFDEPNVSESKANTTRILDAFRASGRLPEEPPQAQEKGVKAWSSLTPPPTSVKETLGGFLSRLKKGCYAAVTAYVTPDKAHETALQALRHKIRSLTGAATTLGYGPRFLHSTGQLHKGGAANGVFLQITAADKTDAPIPETDYGFSILKRAQALGDFESLKRHRRPTVRLYFSKDAASGLKKIAGHLQKPRPAGQG